MNWAGEGAGMAMELIEYCEQVLSYFLPFMPLVKLGESILDKVPIILQSTGDFLMVFFGAPNSIFFIFSSIQRQ